MEEAITVKEEIANYIRELQGIQDRINKIVSTQISTQSATTYTSQGHVLLIAIGCLLSELRGVDPETITHRGLVVLSDNVQHVIKSCRLFTRQ